MEVSYQQIKTIDDSTKKKKNRLRRNYSDVACTGQVVLTNSLHQLKTDINSIEYNCHLYKEVQIVPTTMIGWYENVN